MIVVNYFDLNISLNPRECVSKDSKAYWESVARWPSIGELNLHMHSEYITVTCLFGTTNSL